MDVSHCPRHLQMLSSRAHATMACKNPFSLSFLKQYVTCRSISPGMVSDIREAAVNNTRLACVAAAHRCHHALRHASDALLKDIGKFVKYFDNTLRENTDAKELERCVSLYTVRFPDVNVSHAFDPMDLECCPLFDTDGARCTNKFF